MVMQNEINMGHLRYSKTTYYIVVIRFRKSWCGFANEHIIHQATNDFLFECDGVDLPTVAHIIQQPMRLIQKKCT